MKLRTVTFEINFHISTKVGAKNYCTEMNGY